MKFCIITHVVHTYTNGKYYGYGPYIREINLWAHSNIELIIVAPLNQNKNPSAIDLPYNIANINFIRVPPFSFTSLMGCLQAIINLPFIIASIFKGMRKADHIHLRCPGNMGLLGTIIQVLFPRKKKTAKYAGNWDWRSQQPLSYRIQQVLLRNIFFTRNMTALVYGEWPDHTKNIKPFFTASYTELDKTIVLKPDIKNEVKLAFIGTLTVNKSPLTSLEVLKHLTELGINAHLTYCGEGAEREEINKKIQEWNLTEKVKLLGNVNADIVKLLLQQTHFLVFISKSEGWPKVVAEAMWWGCVPITTVVSCVPQMLNYGERGFLMESNPSMIAREIASIIGDIDTFNNKSQAGMDWAREYTLERFKREIKELL